MKRDNSLIISRDSISFKDLIIELSHYRELLWVFVKRDIQLIYKQTVLGPLWFFFQPIVSSAIYIFLFHKVGKISTGSIPPTLFFLIGTISWTFFFENTAKVSSILKNNVHLFSKIYFPRMLVCFSINFSSFIKLLIQLLLVTGYLFISGADVSRIFFVNSVILINCFYLLIYSNLIGLFVTSVTYKYKDLDFIFNYFLQLLMFVTPIFYRVDEATGHYKTAIFFNPLTFGFNFMHTSLELDQYSHFPSLLIGAGIFFTFVSVASFIRAERKFIDTI